MHGALVFTRRHIWGKSLPVSHGRSPTGRGSDNPGELHYAAFLRFEAVLDLALLALGLRAFSACPVS